MTETERPGFRSRLRPEWARPALGLLVASQLVAAPALAETRQASLGVTATVLPSCVVSTQGGTASTSCSNFGEGSFGIERDHPRAESSSDPAPRESTQIPPRPSDVTYVTITY
jgi:hypothetical protein